MSVPPGAASPDPAIPSPPAAANPAPDLGSEARLLADAGAVALRLLAGAVPRRTFDQLRTSVQQGVDEPSAIHAAILADRVDARQLLTKAAAAQRDWILRGGRTRGPSLTFRAKSLLARLCAQLIVSAIYLLLVVAALLLLRHQHADWDIYRLLPWLQGLLGGR